jgi:hypothetical protein
VRAITWLKISSSDFGYTNESHKDDRQDMNVVGISTRAWIALTKEWTAAKVSKRKRRSRFTSNNRKTKLKHQP